MTQINLGLLENLEDGKCPELRFTNRDTISQLLSNVFTNSSNMSARDISLTVQNLPEANLICTNDGFFPGYFMLGLDFFSRELRTLANLNSDTVIFNDVNTEGSCHSFNKMDYKWAQFIHFCNPLERDFIDYYLDSSGYLAYDRPPFAIRDGFKAPATIFRMTNSPWLLCTIDFVKQFGDFGDSGIDFINIEDDTIFSF